MVADYFRVPYPSSEPEPQRHKPIKTFNAMSKIDQQIKLKTTNCQGFLLVDKPAGMTSHDVVDRVRRLTGERRVGHAGTLDPFATGLLIIGVGRPATREMQKLVGLDKKYEAVFILGKSSDTDDREGVIVEAPLDNHPQPLLHKPYKEGGQKRVLEALKQFEGEIEQVPPTYSAIKIDGKKMYESARAGKPLIAEPRKITVYSISLIRPIRPIGPIIEITLRIHSSTGTYIRAIARDLGASLGGGGYADELRRTAIGPFSIESALPLNSLTPEGIQEHLIPVSDFLARL
jgi:tRNA pseudouridine55 synthase